MTLRELGRQMGEVQYPAASVAIARLQKRLKTGRSLLRSTRYTTGRSNLRGPKQKVVPVRQTIGLSSRRRPRPELGSKAAFGS